LLVETKVPSSLKEDGTLDLRCANLFAYMIRAERRRMKLNRLAAPLTSSNRLEGSGAAATGVPVTSILNGPLVSE
jgi:hypothetical protein